jgi:hypothetical protein
MIPLQELRVGNWIMNKDSGQYIEVKKGFDIDDQSVDYVPVPITPQVLLTCGFVFHNHFKLWQKNKAVSGTGPDMELDPDFWVLDFSHRRIGVELKSLHQLQNLYFALKGNELQMAQ